jgi:hypothetical protein
MTNEDKILEEIRLMRSEQEALKKAVYSVSVRTKRLERSLVGDKDYSQKGVFAKVQEHEDFIIKHRLTESKRAGVIIGISAASGGLVAWLKSLIIGP